MQLVRKTNSFNFGRSKNSTPFQEGLCLCYEPSHSGIQQWKQLKIRPYAPSRAKRHDDDDDDDDDDDNDDDGDETIKNGHYSNLIGSYD